MPEGDKKAAKAAAKAQKSAFGCALHAPLPVALHQRHHAMSVCTHRFLVGQALRASGGMASPSLVSSCMQSVLDEHKR